jgi:hypothetical protein
VPEIPHEARTLVHRVKITRENLARKKGTDVPLNMVADLREMKIEEIFTIETYRD